MRNYLEGDFKYEWVHINKRIFIMSNIIEQFVQTAMPFAGSLLGGPLGNQVGSFIAKILTGNEKSTEEDVEHAIANISPDKLVELRKFDSDYKSKLLDIEIEKIRSDASDRAGARDMQIKFNEKSQSIQSKMTAILGICLLTMFFIILLLFMLYPIQNASKDVLEILIGSLAIWCGQTINFYFGTTHGSMEKTRLLADLKK